MSITQKLQAQVERLYRRYLAVTLTIDYIDILDLAHCLRIWVEIASDKSYTDILSKYNVFTSSKISKSATRCLRNNEAEYIWFTTANYCHANALLIQMDMAFKDNIPIKKPKVSIKTQVAPSEGCRPNGLRGFYYGNSIEFKNKNQTESRKNLTIQQFLDSEMLFYSLGDENQKLSAKTIIRRVSNSILDASHFQDLAEPSEAGVMKGCLPLIAATNVGGMSLLYFVLIYIAQEILIGLGKIERHAVIKKTG
jgi:hypothetical protein